MGYYFVEFGVNRNQITERENASNISLLFGIHMNQVRTVLRFEYEDVQPNISLSFFGPFIADGLTLEKIQHLANV